MHTPAAQQSTEQNASCTVTRGEQRTTMRHWIDLLRADPVARGATASAILFILLSLLLWRYHDLPYYWDALGYVFSHSQQIYDTNLFPILTDWDVGHPTLFFFCVGFLMKLFGVGPLAGHLATWAFTAVLLCRDVRQRPGSPACRAFSPPRSPQPSSPSPSSSPARSKCRSISRSPRS